MYLRLQKFRRGKCEEKRMTSLKTKQTHCTNHHGVTAVLAVALQKVREKRLLQKTHLIDVRNIQSCLFFFKASDFR